MASTEDEYAVLDSEGINEEMVDTVKDVVFRLRKKATLLKEPALKFLVDFIKQVDLKALFPEPPLPPPPPPESPSVAAAHHVGVEEVGNSPSPPPHSPKPIPPSAGAPVPPAAAPSSSSVPPAESKHDEEMTDADPEVVAPDKVDETLAPIPAVSEDLELSEADMDLVGREKSAGKAALNEGNFSQAIQHFNQAIAKSPSAPLFASRAHALNGLKKPNMAIRDAEAALKINPDSTVALRARGLARALLGKYAESLADLFTAQRCDYDEAITTRIKEIQKRQEEFKSKSKPASSSAPASASATPHSASSADSEEDPHWKMPSWLPTNIQSKINADPELLRVIKRKDFQAASKRGPQAVSQLKDPQVATAVKKVMGMLASASATHSSSSSSSPPRSPSSDDIDE